MQYFGTKLVFDFIKLDFSNIAKSLRTRCWNVLGYFKIQGHANPKCVWPLKTLSVMRSFLIHEKILKKLTSLQKFPVKYREHRAINLSPADYFSWKWWLQISKTHLPKKKALRSHCYTFAVLKKPWFAGFFTSSTSEAHCINTKCL